MNKDWTPYGRFVKVEMDCFTRTPCSLVQAHFQSEQHQAARRQHHDAQVDGTGEGEVGVHIV